MDWKHLLAYITGTVDQALLLRNEYLVTENRILRSQITGRVRLTDSCSGLQWKWLRPAISAFSGPHYLHLSPTSGPHYMRLRLQSSSRDCNSSPQDRIICN